LARVDKSHAHTQSLRGGSGKTGGDRYVSGNDWEESKRRVDQWNPNDKAAKSSWKKFLLLLH
jgi:hypothetical protein